MEKKLPVGWKYVQLGDKEYFQRFGGGTPNKGDKDHWDEGTIPWLSNTELRDDELNIICTTKNKITDKGLRNSSATIIPRNCVLLTCTASIGKVGINEIELATNQQFNSFKCSDEVSPKYLAYFLLTQKTNLLKLGGSTSYCHINTINLGKLKVPLPPLETQRRIVAILNKAEETRSLRAQADELLGKLPFSIFIEMFGDPMKNIKGWNIVTPADVASDDKNAITIGPFGSDLLAKDYRSQGVPLIFVRNIRENKFQGNDIRFVDESKGEELKSHRVNPGDVLMTKMGDPPGDVALYPENVQPGIITADCIKLTLNPRIANASFILWVFRTDYVRNQVIRSTKGAAQQKINLSTFRSIKFPLPEIELQNQFSEKVNQVEEIRNLQALSNPQIEHLLASLMHKAFVGDLVP